MREDCLSSQPKDAGALLEEALFGGLAPTRSDSFDVFAGIVCRDSLRMPGFRIATFKAVRACRLD